MAIGGPPMPAPHAAARSLLAHYLALLYGLAIAYASLQPFAPWIAPAYGTPFFLLAPWPPRWTRFDVIANAIAYLPFGVFVALIPYRRPARARGPGSHAVRRAAVACHGDGPDVSPAARRERYRPHRQRRRRGRRAERSGAGSRNRRARGRALVAFRVHWFLRGKVGDFGLALLAIWLVVQVEPRDRRCSPRRSIRISRSGRRRCCRRRPSTSPAC